MICFRLRSLLVIEFPLEYQPCALKLLFSNSSSFSSFVLTFCCAYPVVFEQESLFHLCMRIRDASRLVKFWSRDLNLLTRLVIVIDIYVCRATKFLVVERIKHQQLDKENSLQHRIVNCTSFLSTVNDCPVRLAISAFDGHVIRRRLTNVNHASQYYVQTAIT